MRVEDLPHGGWRVPDGVDPTQVHEALWAMLRAWSDDPDRLAVACYAECWLGTWYGNLGDMVDPADTGLVGWTLVCTALHRKRAELVRARAAGLLYGLEATARSHRFAYLHDIARDVFPRLIVEDSKLRIVGNGLLRDGTYVLDRRDES